MADARGPRGVRRPATSAPDGGASPGQGHGSGSGSRPRPDGPNADPDDDLGACTDAAVRVSRALLGVVAASLAPVLERVTLAQFRALVLLTALGPTRIGALAERLGVHQSTFTRTTDRMVDAGIVRRVENPDNRREVLVEATEAGMAYVQQVTDRRRAELELIVARLEPGDRPAVCRALEAFVAVAGEPTVEALAVLGGG